KARQGRDDLLHHSVSKILLLRITTHIFEGQHGNRRFVREGQRYSRHSGASTHILHVLGLTGHNADKAKALAWNCANQSLLFTAVANRFARGVDAGGQVRLGNETSGPNRVQQVILGDHALSILNQINQQIENLRLDGDLLGTSPKLAPVDIQGIVLEEKLHLDDLLGSLACDNLKK